MAARDHSYCRTWLRSSTFSIFSSYFHVYIGVHCPRHQDMPGNNMVFHLTSTCISLHMSLFSTLYLIATVQDTQNWARWLKNSAWTKRGSVASKHKIYINKPAKTRLFHWPILLVLQRWNMPIVSPCVSARFANPQYSKWLLLLRKSERVFDLFMCIYSVE